jgi:hypothetical protein
MYMVYLGTLSEFGHYEHCGLNSVMHKSRTSTGDQHSYPLKLSTILRVGVDRYGNFCSAKRHPLGHLEAETSLVLCLIHTEIHGSLSSSVLYVTPDAVETCC